MDICSQCGLAHAPDQLFVATAHDDRPVLEDTCQLEPAWRVAHDRVMPHGSLAYHATDSLEVVLTEGLDPKQGNLACKHVCLAETPEIAAGTMELRRAFNRIPPEVMFPVLEVNVEGLDLFFELGEARHHGSVIEPARLALLNPQPAPDITGWSDPAQREQHTDCLVLAGLPTSRRAIRSARAEADRRYG